MLIKRSVTNFHINFYIVKNKNFRIKSYNTKLTRNYYPELQNLQVSTLYIFNIFNKYYVLCKN